MLGKLFSNLPSSLTPRGVGSPNSTRPNTSLESVQEDIHTRNLLFPDADALYQHQHDQVFPLSSSAVPLLTSSTNAFDLSPEIDLDVKDVRVVIMQEATSFSNSAALLYDSHPLAEIERRDSNGANGANSRTGNSVASPRRISLGQTSKPLVIAETPRTFGAFDRRPSTHIRTSSFAETEGQKSAREYREEMSTFSSCIFGSSDIMAYKGTGTKVHIIPTEIKAPTFDHGSLGRSSIRSSRLAQSYTSESIHAPASAGHHKLHDKKKVLITRIFPVPLPTTDKDDAASQFPFPEVGPDGKVPKKPQPKQKRTPMYAIGLIVQLPATQVRPARPSSYNEHDSFPSSFSSLKPAGWTVLGDGFGIDSLESSLISDVDDRIDMITQHWDVIMRTLSHLQTVASATILALLRDADVASPSPVKSHVKTASISISGKRVDETVRAYKPLTSNAKLVQLAANALSRHDGIKAQIDSARARVVNGIKILQVVTRQGRWGIWREEARWVSKWAGGKEEGFFFYNLLTAFLGTHTEWLQALGPAWYRRRHYQQQRAGKDEDSNLVARTVVVAHDKIAARRLIFLLSAFLSPNQQQLLPYTRTYRPSTANSFGGYSQSPPSYMPSREESLRRKVNRRHRSVHSRTISFPQQVKEEQERKNPDTLKTANLPIPGSDSSTRKSSAATTTTVTPVTTMPHFSTRRSVRGTGPVPRPGSSGSLAADDLIRSLKRGDSNASSDSNYSRWGSMASWGTRGFWKSSTVVTDTSVEGAPKSKLTEMVEEAQRHEVSPATLTYSAPEQPAKPPVPYESPVKTSVNDDGVIDIDVPLPDFLTSSFGSVISSPCSSGYLSGLGPGLEGFEHYTRCEDSPLNVGGWLPRYHPDFTLQAIPPQERLEEEIKASMRAEPTPAHDLHGESQWVDVSSALIADTTSFTIKRIRYRRHVKLRTLDEAHEDRSHSNYGNPYTINAPVIDAVLGS
jgi:hypothetical protein